MHVLEQQHCLECAAAGMRTAARHLDRVGAFLREGKREEAAVAMRLAGEAMERCQDHIEACVNTEVAA